MCQSPTSRSSGRSGLHALGRADILRLSNVPRVEHTRIQSDWSIAMGSCRVFDDLPAVCSEFVLELCRNLSDYGRALSRGAAGIDYRCGAPAATLGGSPRRP